MEDAARELSKDLAELLKDALSQPGVSEAAQVQSALKSPEIAAWNLRQVSGMKRVVSAASQTAANLGVV